jgi:hypothetical protein
MVQLLFALGRLADDVDTGTGRKRNDAVVVRFAA